MRLFSTVFALPASLIVLVSQAAADQAAPTAIKKLSFNSNEKILAQHLAFSPLLSPFETVPEERYNGDITSRYWPAYKRHHDETEENLLRRAAEALAMLEKRASCPPGMNSCDYQGSPNKCCQDGTYCTDVPDTMVGHVACCPDGASCGGGVADCPSDAVTCPPDLGGGCCIPGYVCQGEGCVPSASATPSPTTTTEATTTRAQTTKTTTKDEPTETTTTTTSTKTTKTTKTTSTDPTTRTTTRMTTATATTSATGGAPWRPITSTEMTSGDDTQTGCPTGFYGCLATHGGGCCRTDRNCETYSCPPPEMTTLISDGATVVVPATDVPTDDATSTCAGGWFLCGKDAGPVAGCCPSGYDCGTASCFSAEASQTGQVQKEFPKKDSSRGLRAQGLLVGGVAALSLLFTIM